MYDKVYRAMRLSGHLAAAKMVAKDPGIDNTELRRAARRLIAAHALPAGGLRIEAVSQVEAAFRLIVSELAWLEAAKLRGATRSQFGLALA